jgi:hypothetical protein
VPPPNSRLGPQGARFVLAAIVALRRRAQWRDSSPQQFCGLTRLAPLTKSCYRAFTPQVTRPIKEAAALPCDKAKGDDNSHSQEVENALSSCCLGKLPLFFSRSAHTSLVWSMDSYSITGDWIGQVLLAVSGAPIPTTKRSALG